MRFLNLIGREFSSWIDCIAMTAVALRARFISARTVRLVESADGSFTVSPGDGDGAPAGADNVRIDAGEIVGAHASGVVPKLRGSRVEVILQPNRFVFRPLDLPHRAAEFLEGIVRAQIDRLTPWSPEEAAFGWGRPVALAGDRIVVTVAATARSMIMPLVDAVAGYGPDSVVVSTPADGGGSDEPLIRVFEQKARELLDIRKWHRVLVRVLAAACLVAALAFLADLVFGGMLQARQDEMVNKIVASRATMRANLDASRNSALGGLERRKHAAPASVIVLEALSHLLPDHTYVTELRIVDDKVQIIGVTRDAPMLIRLIEQSSYFARPSFFAPTTRSPSEVGDSFHIEAQILPMYTPPT
jgi:general secretion pathway protein L